MPPFSEKSEQLNFLTLYNLNTNLWPFTAPNVRTTCRIWKIVTFLEFLSQGRRSDILLNKIEALLIFDPLITLWGHFKASYFKMLNDARVASTCLYVRTCQRVRNSKNIATVRDFQAHVRVISTMKQYRILRVWSFYNRIDIATFPPRHIRHVRKRQ